MGGLLARLDATAAHLATTAANLDMTQADALQAGLEDGAIVLAVAIAARQAVDVAVLSWKTLRGQAQAACRRERSTAAPRSGGSTRAASGKTVIVLNDPACARALERRFKEPLKRFSQMSLTLI